LRKAAALHRFFFFLCALHGPRHYLVSSQPEPESSGAAVAVCRRLWPASFDRFSCWIRLAGGAAASEDWYPRAHGLWENTGFCPRGAPGAAESYFRTRKKSL